MPNNRPSGGTPFAQATTAGGAAVYRTTPNPSGSTTSLPAVGATATAEVWQEVFADGATTPSHRLVAGVNQVRGTSPIIAAN